MTDLFKAFDGILHELLIVKLYTYGVDIKSLRLLYGYSNGRRQRVKINDNYSSFEGMLSWVPQGSILGLLLLNISINDLFLIYVIETASYAAYFSYNNFKDVITCLERTADDYFTSFYNNGMKANADKCHFS